MHSELELGPPEPQVAVARQRNKLAIIVGDVERNVEPAVGIVQEPAGELENDERVWALGRGNSFSGQQVPHKIHIEAALERTESA